jgi:hypothetical protein
MGGWKMSRTGQSRGRVSRRRRCGMRRKRRAGRPRRSSANGGRKRRNGQAARRQGRSLVGRNENKIKKREVHYSLAQGSTVRRYHPLLAHRDAKQPAAPNGFGNTASVALGACSKSTFVTVSRCYCVPCCALARSLGLGPYSLSAVHS